MLFLEPWVVDWLQLNTDLVEVEQIICTLPLPADVPPSFYAPPLPNDLKEIFNITYARSRRRYSKRLKVVCVERNVSEWDLLHKSVNMVFKKIRLIQTVNVQYSQFK